MALTDRTHSTNVELSEPGPLEVPVGTDLVFKVRVSCPAGCDLRGLPIEIIAPDGIVLTRELATCDAGSNATGDLTLKAPQKVGRYAWRVVFPPHELGGVRHAESARSICVTTKPHGTSLAAWAIPSPVVTGSRFEIKVGAKSSGGCQMNGAAIEVCDETDAVVARGRLQETPWPGTSGLYWTPVELVAPVTEGLCSWSVGLAAAQLELPHEAARSRFDVAVVKPPEHSLTVKVIEKDTAYPIENAQVRLGAYRATTDRAGLAQLRMPKGHYELDVWKVGYEAPSRSMEISTDASVEIEVLPVAEEDPDAAWLM